ncbi:hypothetical protein ACLB2K_025603 [Fragaria x ananassa]
MERKDNQSPQDETARILVEFLEVAITSIVFLKGIYPPGAFERRKYMNLVVHRARHPELRDYIHSAVLGLLPSIKKGLVERVSVIFFDSDNNPMERFMFKLTVDGSCGSNFKEADLEFSLRSFFIKLPVIESVTRVLPQNCRWEITAYFRSLPQESSTLNGDYNFQLYACIVSVTPGKNCNIHYAIHSIFAYTMRQKLKDVIWRIGTIHAVSALSS